MLTSHQFPLVKKISAISISTSTRKKDCVCFSCAYAYAYFTPVPTNIFLFLCLCLCLSHKWEPGFSRRKLVEVSNSEKKYSFIPVLPLYNKRKRLFWGIIKSLLCGQVRSISNHSFSHSLREFNDHS